MTSIPPTGESLTRGTSLAGMRMAADALWGDAGRRAIADRLSAEARAATIDGIVLPLNWYPTRYTLEWYEAAFDGPARRDDAAACAFVDRAIDLGFGRIRRFFLRLASAELMAARAPEIWKHEHTHGRFQVVVRPEKNGATATLSGHPFVASAIGRRMEAEGYRHIVALAGYKDARESHGVDPDGSFVVRLTWRVS